MTEDKKLVEIIVEGTRHEWPEDEKLCFDQVVIWAYPDYSPTDGRTYTVTFEKGHDDKHEEFGTRSKDGSTNTM